MDATRIYGNRTTSIYEMLNSQKIIYNFETRNTTPKLLQILYTESRIRHLLIKNSLMHHANLCNGSHSPVCSLKTNNHRLILFVLDEQYHSMPKLFQLDDFDACLASRRGAFCLGTFELMEYRNDRLLKDIQVNILNTIFLNHAYVNVFISYI